MNGDLLGFKFSAWEGGHRVPFIARWPEKIRAGQTNDELMTTMDLLPTFAKLAGAEIPTDRVIDGKDIWPVLAGDAKTPHEAFYYHRRDDLAAVRSGDWKLHTKNGKPLSLFDLDSDIAETKNVLRANPAVAKRLMGYMNDFAKDIGKNRRPAAFVEAPKPLSK